MSLHPSLSLVAVLSFAGSIACGSNDQKLDEGGEPGGSSGTQSGGAAGETASGGSSGSSASAGMGAGATTGGSSGSTASGGTGATAGSGTTTGGGAGQSAGGAGGGGAGSNAGGRSSGGSSSAGTSSAGAGTGGGAGATPTSGCGKTDFPPAGAGSLTVEGTDVPREYIVALPDDYDPEKPHRLVFAFHGLTGTAEQIAGGFGGGFYGLSSRLGEDTIFVAPQGLAPDDEPDQYGWPNSGGRDIAFVKAMLTSLESSYCIDESRIFSVGMSYGGIMSNTIGCEMSDVFRGIAPIAGAMFGRNDCDGPPLAVWMAHGTADETVEFTSGEAARDVFLEKNQCDASIEPTPVEPEGCVSYAGCAAGAPVVWCVHDGGHIVPSFAAQAISDFFGQF